MLGINKNCKFSNRVKNLTKVFYNYFGFFPTDAFTSPGRIELLGNHTDHNNGMALVSTIDLNILSLGTKSDDNHVTFHSSGFPIMDIDLEDLEKKGDERGESIGIVRGVLYRLKELGYNIGGIKACTTTTIFQGAGVSSSAAFELLIAKMISFFYNDDSIDPIVLAKVCQFAEVEYFEKPCGLLDQIGISIGSINFIDFKSTDQILTRKVYAPFKNYEFVLVQCKDGHSNLTHLYSKIKEDMFKLASYFGKNVLRDVYYKDYFNAKEDLIAKFGEDIYLRGKHYFEENLRVRKGLESLIKKDEKTFIKLLNESGESSFYQLKNCYIKSVEENLPKGILKSKEIINDGAVRVHGGGFAGTILALVNKDEVDNYVTEMKKLFGNKKVKRIVTNRFGTRHISRIEEVLTQEELNEIKGE